MRDFPDSQLNFITFLVLFLVLKTKYVFKPITINKYNITSIINTSDIIFLYFYRVPVTARLNILYPLELNFSTEFKTRNAFNLITGDMGSKEFYLNKPIYQFTGKSSPQVTPIMLNNDFLVIGMAEHRPVLLRIGFRSFWGHSGTERSNFANELTSTSHLKIQCCKKVK